MSDYNGWTNRETWLINVHFNPESREDVEFAKEQLLEEYKSTSLLLQDFIDISVINWDELKKHFPEVGTCELCNCEEGDCETMTCSDNLEWVVCPDCVAEFEENYR